MSHEIERATVECNVCGARVVELRRGRCWGCYTRWGESRPVGLGASCAICDERRRGELRLLELHGRSHPFCHSCAGKIARLEAVPATVVAIRQLLSRERRETDRRGGADDPRIFPRERRVGERRAPERSESDEGTNPHIALRDFEDIVIEIEDSQIEVVEQTAVRPAPQRPPERPPEQPPEHR